MGDGRNLCPAFTDEEYTELLQAAVPDYADLVEWSPLAHCQALSNILKRPLCLFTSLKDLDRQESFIFLPLRHPCKDCYKHPISVAWQGRGKNGELRCVCVTDLDMSTCLFYVVLKEFRVRCCNNTVYYLTVIIGIQLTNADNTFPLISYSHFVPLCRTLDSSAPKIPRSCQPAFHRCSISTGQQYIEYNTDGSFSIGLPVLFSEVQPTHLFKTMGYRFKPHKPDQPGFFHGLIDRLIDSSCQELCLAFSKSGSCSFDISQNGDNRYEGSRSKMTATNLLTKVHFTLFLHLYYLFICNLIYGSSKIVPSFEISSILHLKCLNPSFEISSMLACIYDHFTPNIHCFCVCIDFFVIPNFYCHII